MEVVALLYAANMFTPGLIMRWATLIAVFLPLVDYATDWYTAGSYQLTYIFVVCYLQR